MNLDLTKEELQQLDEIFTVISETLDFHGDYLEHKETFMKLWNRIEKDMI